MPPNGTLMGRSHLFESPLLSMGFRGGKIAGGNKMTAFKKCDAFPIRYLSSIEKKAGNIK